MTDVSTRLTRAQQTRDETAERGSTASPVVRRRVVPGREEMVVGAENDPAERSADALADRAVHHIARQGVRLSNGGPSRIRRSSMPSQSAATIGAAGGALDGATERTLASTRGAGQSLDAATAAHLAPTMGDGVGRVRLHTGAVARKLNEGMQAEAFAVGNDVYFRDGMPDTSTESGMHLLAHEVAHTVQDSGGIGRRVVRRKLIPKAADAFALAKQFNPSYATGETNTDTYAREADQEDLARVHGRFNLSKGSEGQQKVAKFVRAVVLSEYAARLEANENDPNKSDKDKAKRRPVYKKKADEFRQKHTPLVEKGPDAPETQSFLREHGFEGAITRSAKAVVKNIKQGARIDVRSTFIGGPVLGINLRAHLFIVYTGKDGKQFYFRGGPDEDDYTEADWGEYTPSTVDWDPSAPSVTVLEGDKAENKLDALIEATSVINGMRVPYRATTERTFGGDKPNFLQKGINMISYATTGEGENCNATAWTILTRAGIPTSKPVGKHPGWGGKLGSRTDGKKDAEPEKETFGDPKPYTIDTSLVAASPKGFVQVYKDRGLITPMTRISHGYKVQLLDESRSWLRILVDGQLGYVRRSKSEIESGTRVAWVNYLKSTLTPEQIEFIRDADEDHAALEQYADDKGIEVGELKQYALYALDEDEFAEDQIWKRMHALGDDRIREMLDNPDELAKVAAETGAAPDKVLKLATSLVEGKEAVAKIPALLQKLINDPNAANMALNELPDLRTVEEIADEIEFDEDDVAERIDAMRPPEHQGKFLKKLAIDDRQILNELDNPPGYMVKAFAKETGVSEAYVKQQFLLWHAERNPPPKPKQEAPKGQQDAPKGKDPEPTDKNEKSEVIGKLVEPKPVVDRTGMPKLPLYVKEDDNDLGDFVGYAYERRALKFTTSIGMNFVVQHLDDPKGEFMVPLGDFDEWEKQVEKWEKEHK